MILAQLNWGDPNIFKPAQFSTMAAIVNVVSPILITGGAMLFLAMTLTAAFNVLTAGGNPEKIAKAQKIFMFAILGLLVVVFSFLAVRLLGVIFNIQNELKPLGF